jgi:hypothetical protein
VACVLLRPFGAVSFSWSCLAEHRNLPPATLRANQKSDLYFAAIKSKHKSAIKSENKSAIKTEILLWWVPCVTTSEADFCCHSSDFMEGGEAPDMEGAPPRRWVNIDSGCNAFTIELGLGGEVVWALLQSWVDGSVGLVEQRGNQALEDRDETEDGTPRRRRAIRSRKTYKKPKQWPHPEASFSFKYEV